MGQRGPISTCTIAIPRSPLRDELRPRPGSMAAWDSDAGGVAALHHRLQAVIPPGWMRGCARGRARSRRWGPGVGVLPRHAPLGSCVARGGIGCDPVRGRWLHGIRVPVVSLRSTTGYRLSSLRDEWTMRPGTGAVPGLEASRDLGQSATAWNSTRRSKPCHATAS